MGELEGAWEYLIQGHLGVLVGTCGVLDSGVLGVTWGDWIQGSGTASIQIPRNWHDIVRSLLNDRIIDNMNEIRQNE